MSGAKKLTTPDKKKNALTKESEYGVSGIKAPLLEVTAKAEEVWGPSLGGREREETMREVLTNMDQHRELFVMSGDIKESMKRNDYDNVVADYDKAMKSADAARAIAEPPGGPLRG